MICDVSKYQGNIDWDTIAKDIDFCIIKASSGKGKDSYYDRNSSECKRLSIPFHAYHFLYAQNEEEASDEAKIFANAVSGTNPLFYVIDVEKGSNLPVSTGRSIIETFFMTLKLLLGSDIRTAIYIGHEFYHTYGLDYSKFDYVWIPRYGSNKGTVESSISPAYPCDLWQYTSRGKLSGISGNVDLDILTGRKPLDYFLGIKSENSKNEPSTVEPPAEEVEEEGFTGKKLAEYCLKVYEQKWVYWYGTYGQKCSQSLYNSKKKQYSNMYTADRESGYMKDIANNKRCADCVGLIKSYFWSGGDINTLPKYATNNCPDKSANGMFSLCKETGSISTIPDIPGLVVWKSGHIGVYVGNGYTVELKGFDYDCEKNKVTSGKWTNWGRLPDSMLSTSSSSSSQKPVSETEGNRYLKNGSKGADVKELQTNLIKLGYSCGSWGADGDFGDMTEAALEQFQREHQLNVTGVYDADTIRVMIAAIEGFDDIAVNPKMVLIYGGDCYIRDAPNTSGKKYGVAKKGTKFDYAGETSSNGWNKIVYKRNELWVSGKYSKLVD